MVPFSGSFNGVSLGNVDAGEDSSGRITRIVEVPLEPELHAERRFGGTVIVPALTGQFWYVINLYSWLTFRTDSL